VIQTVRLKTSDIRLKRGNGQRLNKDKGLAANRGTGTVGICERVSKNGNRVNFLYFREV